MNNKPIYYSIIVSLSGFLFGFDTIVISGANLPIKALWHTSSWFHGFFIMSVALWGTVLGAMLGGILCDHQGRKTTLFWIGVLYFMSALGTALATDPYIFSAYRFLGGFAIGISTIAAPAYISEISPARHRGKLVGLFQINIVIGILAAYISNYFLEGFGGKNDWRWMLGVEMIPSILFIGLILHIPESPRWLLLKKGSIEKATKIFKTLYKGDVENATSVVNNILEDKQQTKEKTDLSNNNKPFFLAFLMAFFNQASGINFILYYAPEIMEKAGLSTNQSLLGAVFIGGTNLIFTLWSLSLIDRMGRRHLMISGSIGYLLSLSLIIFGFYQPTVPFVKLFAILVFIASHAIGQGSVIWVFISEIFPNRLRAKGQSFGALVHWTMAALITLFGSVLITNLPPWQIFSIFLFFMVLQILFIFFLMPETKGITLEEHLQKIIPSSKFSYKQFNK
ncbi:MAG: sugar porter family MFS transporter [Cyclobacteriaceae bacterium]